MRMVLAMAFGVMVLGSCAHPLEQVMDEHREQRMYAASAGQPLIHGAGDGIGGYIAEDASQGLTLSAVSKNKITP